MIRYLKRNLKFKRVSNETALSTSNALEKIEEEEKPSSSKSNIQENSKKDEPFIDHAVVRTVSLCKNRETSRNKD